jgi:GntR family transcriptional regulator
MSRTLYAVLMAREEQPKYRQIADDLRARMEAGEYPPDSRLPSKTELMSRYHVALATVNNAIGELRKLGVAETIQGVGTFARKPPADAGLSDYDAVMGRVDEVAAEIRLLKERMNAVERMLPKDEP